MFTHLLQIVLLLCYTLFYYLTSFNEVVAGIVVGFTTFGLPLLLVHLFRCHSVLQLTIPDPSIPPSFD